ncbi:MAG TPA: helix-turn-helix domain-containing protein [Polyangiaceae bacterium]|nr:helix-turn-helix domain-containing protein [Polyangiaceae bacterium]
MKASRTGRIEQLLSLSRRLPRNVTLRGFAFAALEGVQELLGLDRVALFMMSKSGRWLTGLVGTTLERKLVDERHLRHVVEEHDRALWREVQEGRRSFELVEDAPLIAHVGELSQVVGRGWFVKTPIADEAEAVGMLYNDSATAHAAFDDEAQQLLAVFAAIVAQPLRALRDRAAPPIQSGLSQLVADCLELLTSDLSQSHHQLAERLGVTANRLSRSFEAELGKALVEYRNELRLDRFFELAEAAHERERGKLVDLALESGFGSYSQFHRVFVARFGRSPRCYFDA